MMKYGAARRILSGKRDKGKVKREKGKGIAAHKGLVRKDMESSREQVQGQPCDVPAL